MPLTNQDIEALAGLKNDPSYRLLLDKIACLVDDMTQTLAFESDPIKVASTFPLWQALNTVLHELRVQPEIFGSYIEPKEQHSEINNIANEKLKEFLKNSRKHYENETVREQEQMEFAKKEEYGWKSLINKESKLGNIL